MKIRKINKQTEKPQKTKTKITQNYKTYKILFMNTACTQNIFIYCNTVTENKIFV